MNLEQEKKIRVINSSELEKISYLDVFKLAEAIWLFNQSSNSPHALLTSGQHSDGYVNCSQVLKFPNLKNFLAQKLIEKLQSFQPIEKGSIDYVVSSSMAAITLGDKVASILSAAFAYTEKVNEIQKLKRFEIPDGARVLQVEELITTLKTTRQVTQAIQENNPTLEFLRDKEGRIIVLSLVHRPEKLPQLYPDYQIISLIELEIHTWSVEQCPLCPKGSQALKPKKNWEKFINNS